MCVNTMENDDLLERRNAWQKRQVFERSPNINRQNGREAKKKKKKWSKIWTMRPPEQRTGSIVEWHNLRVWLENGRMAVLHLNTERVVRWWCNDMLIHLARICWKCITVVELNRAGKNKTKYVLQKLLS